MVTLDPRGDRPLATTSIKSAGRVIAEARNRGLRDLSVEVLSSMRDEARALREDMAVQIQEEGVRFSEARESGQWQSMEDCRGRIFGMQEDLQGIEDHIGLIEDAYQERYLQAGVVGALGSAQRASYLEAGIMLLIAAVLGILWVEGAYTLTQSELHLLAIADTVICAIFLTEFFWRMRYADSKAWYWRRFWVDFIASLPLAGILRIGRIARVARIARMARIARAARLIRVLRVLAFLSRGFDKIAAIFRLQVFSRPLILTVGLLVVGGVAITYTDSGASEVNGFWAGIWWSFTTVVTGGFGDIYNPESAMGKLLTVLLVILGIILTGALTAGLAQILMGDDTARIERGQSNIQAQLEDVTARIDRIESSLGSRPDEHAT